MKIPPIIISASAFSLFMLIVGCATPPSIERDGKKLTQATGLSSADLESVGHGQFAEARHWDDSITYTKGIIVASANGLHLFPGEIDTIEKDRAIFIPYSGMHGIGIRRRTVNQQIQVKTESHIYVLSIMKPSFIAADFTANENLFQWLGSKGIEEWDSDTFFMEPYTHVFLPSL